MADASSTTGSVKSELNRLLPRLKSFALALTGSEQLATGLTQATCRQLLSKPPRERGQTAFALWAYTHMHTIWLKQAVAAGNDRGKRRADPAAFAMPGDSPAESGRNGELAQLLAHLPPQQRATLMLVYGEGFSYDEVAEVFGTSLKSVMTRVVRGHIAMAHWLGRQCGAGGPVPSSAEEHSAAARKGQAA